MLLYFFTYYFGSVLVLIVFASSAPPGHNCEFLPCEASNPCENDAVCVEELDQDHFPLGFRCRCHRGFAGPRCEINVDECSSSPCLHGFCYDGKKLPILLACLIAAIQRQNSKVDSCTHQRTPRICQIWFCSLTLQQTVFQLGHHCCLLAAIVLLGSYET